MRTRLFSKILPSWNFLVRKTAKEILSCCRDPDHWLRLLQPLPTHVTRIEDRGSRRPDTGGKYLIFVRHVLSHEAARLGTRCELGWKMATYRSGPVGVVRVPTVCSVARVRAPWTPRKAASPARWPNCYSTMTAGSEPLPRVPALAKALRPNRESCERHEYTVVVRPRPANLDAQSEQCLDFCRTCAG